MLNSHFLRLAKGTVRVRSLVKFLVKSEICYYVQFLATRPPTEMVDNPYPMSFSAYSVYYQFPSISVDHLLHRKPRIGGTLMTRKHLVQLMIHSNYRHSFYHRPVFLVSLTVLLKKFTPQPDFTSIFIALLSLSVVDLVLILTLLLTSF